MGTCDGLWGLPPRTAKRGTAVSRVGPPCSIRSGSPPCWVGGHRRGHVTAVAWWRRGQGGAPARGGASPEPLPQEPLWKLASAHAPACVSHAGVEVGGPCPAFAVHGWPYGPTLSPTTASVVGRCVPSRD